MYECTSIYGTQPSISIIADRASILIGICSLVIAIVAILFTHRQSRKSQKFLDNQQKENQRFHSLQYQVQLVRGNIDSAWEVGRRSEEPDIKIRAYEQIESLKIYLSKLIAYIDKEFPCNLPFTCKWYTTEEIEELKKTASKNNSD